MFSSRFFFVFCLFVFWLKVIIKGRNTVQSLNAAQFLFLFRSGQDTLLLLNFSASQRKRVIVVPVILNFKSSSAAFTGCALLREMQVLEASFNNNVHLSCAHQRPERSHDTY